MHRFLTFIAFRVTKVYGILFFILLVCVGCEWQLKPAHDEADNLEIKIERYDRIESLFLTTGDYSALQQMNTVYPMQTRMLLENVLLIGKVNDPEINTKFLYFFQDSVLQKMLGDVEEQYKDIEDLNDDLTAAFRRLKEELPDLEIPQVYAQIGSFDQSIIVGNNTLGISLDKYLGADYPFYQEHYTDDQRRMMVRDMIVPDCLSFYLLSLYPMPNADELTKEQRDIHMGRIQWVVNQITDHKVFSNSFVSAAEQTMKRHKQMTIHQLLLQSE